MTATIIVETGSIVAGANSYVSAADLATYASDRGVTITGTEEDLLIQAMDYIEGFEYIGYQHTENQPLSWPRSEARKKKIYYYDTNEIPQLLIDGLCEAALAIDAGTNPLANIDRATKKEKVGDLEVEYMDGAASQVIIKKINVKLRELLASGNGVSFPVGKG